MSFNSPFTGQVIQPTDVSFRAITLEADSTLSWPINGSATDNAAARIMDVESLSSGLTLSGVIVTGTNGQCSCTATPSLFVGQAVVVTGTNSGTATGITPGNTYYIIATNGTTTFTLSASLGGAAVATTAGSTTGMTFALDAFSIAMPPANQASVGNDALIRNVGSNSFTVTTYNGGGTIITIGAGEAKYVYIKTNADAYGVWGKKKFMGREYDGIFRTSFLVDPAGKIAKIYESVKPEAHAEEVLADLLGVRVRGLVGEARVLPRHRRKKHQATRPHRRRKHRLFARHPLYGLGFALFEGSIAWLG